MPQIIILGVFGLLFSTCLWAYLKEKRGGRGSVKGKDVAVFVLRLLAYGGGVLLLIFAILLVMHYAGGGHL